MNIPTTKAITSTLPILTQRTNTSQNFILITQATKITSSTLETIVK